MPCQGKTSSVRMSPPRNVTQVNEAEALVYEICRQSFLSLCSYMNPRKKPNGKELCDVLVVCEPDVIVFSVKRIRLANSGHPEVDAERWRKRAVDESCKQIYGAERILKQSKCVIGNDNSVGLALPKAAEVKIHRVAVALGGKRKGGLPFGEFGKGFVHVMDEVSFLTLLKELDTISDFVPYLTAKEAFCKGQTKVLFDGPEENLLAAYLHGGRKLPQDADIIVVGDGLWKNFVEKEEYKRKQEADKDSYVWDRLIEEFSQDFLKGQLEFAPSPSNTERALRQIARENRFARRVLGKGFKEFLDNSHRIGARMMKSPSGVVYVFLASPHGTPRNVRQAELGNRCFVARGLNPQCSHVVGIATERYEKGKSFSLDLCNLFRPNWSAEDQRLMEQMQKDLGYFAKPKMTRDSEDEYPGA
jgi:hypothetical protein